MTCSTISYDRPLQCCARYSVDHIFSTKEFTDAERAAILGQTAARLLGISL